MNYEQAIAAVRAGHTVTREAFKKKRVFTAKIVPLYPKRRKKPKIYLWSRTNIPNVFRWSALEDPADMLEEHRNATDWRKCSRPS